MLVIYLKYLPPGGSAMGRGRWKWTLPSVVFLAGHQMALLLSVLPRESK